MRYRVEEIERTEAGIRYRFGFPADSPFFDGHFPGNPILPGVAQVQICTEVLSGSLGRRVEVREVEAVRFRRPVTPTTPCELLVQVPDDSGRVEFSFHGEDGVLADGRLLVDTVETTATDRRGEP